MRDQEAVLRIREALAIHVESVLDAFEAGDETVPDRGQYVHVREVVERYAASNPTVNEN